MKSMQLNRCEDQQFLFAIKSAWQNGALRRWSGIARKGYGGKMCKLQ